MTKMDLKNVRNSEQLSRMKKLKNKGYGFVTISELLEMGEPEK
jgi:hypothetical protein